MARLKTFYLGALNLTIHPHHLMKYSDLIENVFKMNKKIQVRGDEYATLGSCWPINRDNISEGLYGDIYKYVQLEPNDDWFNIKKETIATQDELNEIKIPDHLKPHFSKFAYIFFPKFHRLIVVQNNEKGKNMSIKTARHFFARLFEDDEIIENFGEVSVTVEQSREELAKMLSLYKINYLSITLTRPNPDDNDSLDEDVLRRLLDEQNVNKAEFNFKAVKGISIVPNTDTKKLARIAVSNGVVEMIGKDSDDIVINKSTEQFPLQSSFKYDTDKHDFRQLSISCAKQFANSILRIDI